MQIDLEKLALLYGFSEALTEALRQAGLVTLSAIRAHYGVHGSFLDLTGLDPMMEDKLLDLLTAENIKREWGAAEGSSLGVQAADDALDQLRGNDPGPPRRPDDLDLEQLSDLFGLSVRVLNVCRHNDLHHLSDIHRFDLRHHGFMKLRNCGAKTQLELRNMLAQAKAQGKISLTDSAAHGLSKEEVEKLFQNSVSQLSDHARTVLLSRIGAAEAARAIRFFMMDGPGMPSVGDAGPGVVEELRAMRRDLLPAMSGYDVEQGTWVAAGRPPMLLEAWALRNGIPAALLPTLQVKAGEMHLLSFLDHYLEVTGTRSKERTQQLYLHGAGFSLSLQDMGDRLGLTRERVRQILRSMDTEFPRRLAFIAELPDVKTHFADLVTSAPVFRTTLEITRMLNEREGTFWSPLFMLYIAQVLNGPGYIHCHWTDLFDRSPISKELDRSTPVLIDADLVPVSTAMLSGLVDLHATKRRKNMELDLFRGQRALGHEHRERLEAVLKVLIAERYPEVQFDHGVVRLPPNKRRNREDRLEDVLASLDEPAHVELIMRKWMEQSPDDPISAAGIRSIVVRGRSRFFSIGRTSTYGLRRWEKERKDLKGGTIRDLVENQLRNSETPLHLDQLTLGLLRFRPHTNVNSVLTNLHHEQGGRFAFFPQGFIGLAGKTYAVMPVPAPRGRLFREASLLRYVGRPLSDLVDDLVARTNADRDLLNAKIQMLIHDRRLIVSPSGIVLHASSAGVREE